MSLNLRELFSALECSQMPAVSETDLFGFDKDEPCFRQYEQSDIDFAGAYFTKKLNLSLLNGQARELFEVSFSAFDIFLHAWLSELPVEREAIRYGKKIIAAAQSADTQEKKRKAADKIAANRTDSDVLAVLNAAAKTGNEVHRMMGLLRFSPNEDGEFIAQ